MKIITDLNFKLNGTAVCIGKFDGIHKGHRLLLTEAKKSGLTVVMFTFLFPGSGKCIYSYEEKLSLAESLGVDVFIAAPVTEDFMRMEPEKFVEEILVRRCDARKVVVGADFRFGHNRAGDIRLLQQMGAKNNYSVAVFDKLREGGEIISSTRIRKLLTAGKLSEVNGLLASPYFIRGRVHTGNKLGRRMDVPTANITPAPDKELPPFGVYAVMVQVEDSWYEGVANLGVKPTIPGENPVGLEVWLFQYQGDLYEKTITAYLMDFLRPEQKFDSLSELKAQIQRDTAQAEEILRGLRGKVPFPCPPHSDRQSPTDR